MNPVKKYVANKLASVIQSQGKLVSVENKNARLEVCNGCEFKGIVEPVPFIKLEGCTICGCPLETKASMLWIWRSKEHEEEPLDMEEIANLVVTKNFNPENFVKNLITCPFSKVNKWQEVDSKFNY